MSVLTQEDAEKLGVHTGGQRVKNTSVNRAFSGVELLR